jgi:DNA mismatch repair protein MutL
VYDAIVAAVSAGLVREEKPLWVAAPGNIPDDHSSPFIPPPSTIIHVSEELRPIEKRQPDVLSEGDNRTTAVTAGLKPVLRSGLSTESPAKPFIAPIPKEQPALWETPRPSVHLMPIGQFYDSYILCESGENLILLDQHAAHERVLYEKLADRSQERRLSVQRLLIPETLDLGYRQAQALEALIPELDRYGFEIEIFGKNSFVVKAVPAILSEREIKPLVMDMLDRILETGLTANPEKAMDTCLKLMACHGAVRANQHLTPPEMTVLIKNLEACSVPAHCPHGRPTWIAWSKQDVERLFKRT